MRNTYTLPGREEIWKMFDKISPTYDLMNQLMTFGLDKKWRKQLALYLPKGNNLKVLDLATGTGDQIIALFKGTSRIRKIVGVDLSPEMLAIGKKKIERKDYAHQVSFKQASALNLPFKEDSFDAVTLSFGIRNFTDVLAALKEIRRVLKPKGRLLILEGSLPKNSFLKKCHLFYMRYYLPWMGSLIAKEKKAYRYLNETIETFPYGSEFLELLKEAGFSHTKTLPLTGGVVAIYLGEKDAL